jgi:hypothetical protein
MSITTFDTYHFVERLERAGMPREQAAAFAEAQKESLAEALESTLATKVGIVRLENRIETLELRLTVKLGAFLSLAVGILIAVLRVSH